MGQSEKQPSKLKLYKVTVEFTYYAAVERGDDAKTFAQQAWDDDGPEYVSLVLVEDRNHEIAGEWLPESLVYGGEGNVELGEMLDKLPRKGERK